MFQILPRLRNHPTPKFRQRAWIRRSAAIVAASILGSTLTTAGLANPAFADSYYDSDAAATAYYDEVADGLESYLPELELGSYPDGSYISDYLDPDDDFYPDYNAYEEHYSEWITANDLVEDFEEWRSNFPRLDFTFGDTNERGHGLSRDVWQPAEFTLSNVPLEYAQFTGEQLQIRGRGNTSWTFYSNPTYFGKLPFRIRFAEPQVMLNADPNQPARDWTLIANHLDFSLMRNYMTYRLAGNLDGMNDAPFARLVDVYWNGDYRGVYMLSIQHSDAAIRVPLNAAQEPAVSEFLVERNLRLLSSVPPEPHEGSNWVRVGVFAYEIRYPGSVNGDNRAARQRRGERVQEIIGNIDQLLRDRSPDIWYYIDKESFVDYYLVLELSKDVDYLSSEFFQIKLDSSGRQIVHMGPVWDFDRAFGNEYRRFSEDGVGTTDIAGLWGGARHPWFRALLDYPEFREAIASRLTEVTSPVDPDPGDPEDVVLSPLEDALSHVQHTAIEHEESFNRNFERWPVLDRPNIGFRGPTRYIDTFMGQIDYLVDWTRQRAAWLRAYFNENPLPNLPVHPDLDLSEDELDEWLNSPVYRPDEEVYLPGAGDGNDIDNVDVDDNDETFTNDNEDEDDLIDLENEDDDEGIQNGVDDDEGTLIEVEDEDTDVDPDDEDGLPDFDGDPFDRWYGVTRIETAVAISRETFADNSQPQIVFITNAWNFPDALAAAAVADRFDGPVLLVDPNPARNTAVIEELNRLRPQRVVVLGSVNSVSASVFNDLNAQLAEAGIPQMTMEDRWYGDTRIETAVEISRRSFDANTRPEIAFITNAWNFPDAVAAAAVSGRVDGPVLLVDPNPARNTAVIEELNRLRPHRVVVLGSVNSVSAAVFNDINAHLAEAGLPQMTAEDRWFGDTRIETAVAISQETFKDNSQPRIVFITDAWNFPDALAAAAVAGGFNGPVLLVDPNPARNTAVIEEINRLRPQQVVKLGSVNSVSDAVYAQLRQYVNFN
jgi:putative cell wall-binding protein